MQRLLLFSGTALILLGLLWPYVGRLGLGRLPGDLALRRGSFSFYFPFTTCLLLSLVVSAIFWVLRR